ncbi:MAG: DUF2218 domain-containing protein [Rhodobacter sp.]|nr:DUF2218 domain-containing protein [Paracoccaceae bacterium]MCB1410169.1 DUF2218 domain-containing protein [Paracoccaceae bacterium]MCC0081515.1 DUF2218 domain-containing protein [Rhodobacter sp.]
MSAISTAILTTPNASRYLQQLCKHFAHKLPTEFTPEAGFIDFSMGRCTLAAQGETLTLTATAPDAESRARLEDVVARHLVRFAFREDLSITWTA